VTRRRSPRDDALAIWRASLAAVRSDQLVRRWISVADGQLRIGPLHWQLDSLGRIEVVGAGKAGAGMAAGLEEALGQRLLAAKQVNGWINVPADCVVRLSHVHLHAARPAGHNEPSPEGLPGSDEILRRVAALQANDLCICLISGGGSALLPAPRPGLNLDDLRQVTQELSSAGATIQQLNAVRKRLSRIHGGGLARACRAGQLVTLIISDVMGDPLDIIASGPTVIEDEVAAAQRAVDVLRQFAVTAARLSPAIHALLQDDLQHAAAQPATTHATHLVIGNNATATEAARVEAERRGYTVQLAPPQAAEVTAEETGRWLADALERQHVQRSQLGPLCLVSGGEPVVKLVAADQRGHGGRNQQLVLAALCQWLNEHSPWRARQLLLSGGTDGEDGPTDAAGALVDRAVVRQMLARQLDPVDFLLRNDAYTFFQATGGLIRTGPTHTNVGDVRIALTT
jgi:hydroxypyruvate reductase